MKWSKYLIIICSLTMLFACASIGSPDGGDYDEEPPKVLYATPGNLSLNANQKKISIYFDEYIKLENASEKVTVSPPQEEMPNIRVDGRRIKIDLYDDLKPNTTYTIDFSDAISDNNEGNPMGLFTYSFSTGNTIDTMEVSGVVLNAEDLEPIKGIHVGLYPADSLSDTIFRTKPLVRVGRTNGSGKFTIKGVANGRYAAYALKDMDNNYRFTQKSEQLAFDTTTFLTHSNIDWRRDTIWKDTAHVRANIKRIEGYPYIHYYPDNLVLLAFLEDGQSRNLLKTERLVPEKFTFYFTAPSDELPIIEGLNFDPKKLFCQPSLHKDTVTYWIPDTSIAYNDTLRFNLTYQFTDTLGNLVHRTDSAHELVPRQTHARLEKERQKKSDEWEKARQKKIRKAKEAIAYEENPFEHTYMDVQVKPSGSIDPNQNVSFVFSEPIDTVFLKRLHFHQKIDSTLTEVPYRFLPDKDNPCRYVLYAAWEPKCAYVFEADSMAFMSILGHPARPLKNDIRVKSEDEYGTLRLRMTNVGIKEGEKVYVELLNKSDKAAATSVMGEDNMVDFYYLKPGDYYLRLFIDRNGNGKWDTGCYDEGLQPEEVFYFNHRIPVRAMQDVEQTWNVRMLPKNEQKPKEITKQKPDKQKMSKDRNRERQEQRNRQRRR